MQGEAYTWGGEVVHTSESEPHVAVIRHNRQGRGYTVTIGNTDLPAIISDGKLYVQAPLGLVFEAFAEDFSAFVRDMEIRVSTPWGAPLSLDSDGRPVSRPRVAKSRVVRRGGQR